MIHREQRSGNTLYQELSFQDNDNVGDLEDGPEVTGKPLFVIFTFYLSEYQFPGTVNNS